MDGLHRGAIPCRNKAASTTHGEENERPSGPDPALPDGSRALITSGRRPDKSGRRRALSRSDDAPKAPREPDASPPAALPLNQEIP